VHLSITVMYSDMSDMQVPAKLATLKTEQLLCIILDWWTRIQQTGISENIGLLDTRVC